MSEHSLVYAQQYLCAQACGCGLIGVTFLALVASVVRFQTKPSQTILWWFNRRYISWLGQANYIHSLASATSLNYMRAGGTIIRLHSWGQYSKTYILHTGYSLEALLRPQIGATPLKFEPNQLEAGRLSTMRALMLNYKCSLLGLTYFLPNCNNNRIWFVRIMSSVS